MSVAVTSVPSGSVPVTVAVLATAPASTSAWVSVYVAVHVVDSPGASVVDRAVHRPDQRVVHRDPGRG